MGLYIKKSVKGTRIFHSVTDKPIHSGWLKTDQAIKKVLIKVHLTNFFKEVISINYEGVGGYQVNNKHVRETGEGIARVIQAINGNYLEKEASKILKSLKITI